MLTSAIVITTPQSTIKIPFLRPDKIKGSTQDSTATTENVDQPRNEELRAKEEEIARDASHSSAGDGPRPSTAPYATRAREPNDDSPETELPGDLSARVREGPAKKFRAE
jgi:hypothetical protein